MPEAAEGVKTMDEVSNDTTKENNTMDATIAVNEEEAQKRREQATENEAMARRIRDLSASRGKRNDEVIQEDKDKGSNNDVANSA